MKYVLSRYNHDIAWLSEYTTDFVIYDRSEQPTRGSIPVPNIGSDIYDKFTFIIDNYDNLPPIAVYTKANLFKYISKKEFDALDKTKFQPLLTQHHKTHLPVSYYEDGLYYEINNYYYLIPHPPKSRESFEELRDLLKFTDKDYLGFSPGSNYILTKENIRRYPKSLYIKLRSFLEWSVYPGECQMMERGLYYLWGTDTIDGI